MDALTQPARESNRSIFLFRIGIGFLLISIALTLLMTQMQEGPPARDFLFAACLFVVAPLASIASVLSFSAVRRRPLLSVCLLPVAYVFGFMLHISAVFAEAAALGPYTDWYNHTKKSRAEAARLVGSSESRVIPVLGNADYVWRNWDRVITATGLPAPGAEFWTTYNYCPYPGLPMRKFQVHCTAGIVRGIELFDD